MRNFRRVWCRDRIRSALAENGYRLFFETPTNQIYVVFENERLPELASRVEYGFWEKYDDSHTVIRFSTSWATKDEDVDELVRILMEMA